MEKFDRERVSYAEQARENFREARRAFCLEMAVQLVGAHVEKVGMLEGVDADKTVRIAREFERYLTEAAE